MASGRHDVRHVAGAGHGRGGDQYGLGAGCGRSWPLCNGQFVPEFTVETAIEYSHRAVTGIEGLLIVALTVVMLRLWRANAKSSSSRC